MIYISHRGNLRGANPELENTPSYCLEALRSGYWVELDLWAGNGLFLGHDGPQYSVEEDCELFHGDPKVLIHAKDAEAVLWCRDRNLHWFWHQEDDVTSTSKGFPVSHVRLGPVEGMLSMVFGFPANISRCLGVCSDEIEKYRLWR